MKRDLSSCAPPGLDLKTERKVLILGGICAVLYSFGFLLRWGQAYQELFVYRGSQRLLLEGAVMPDFYLLLGRALFGFGALALCMLAFIAYHYAYHRQGSKSIYLMKRLPNRRELHRRCLTLPLAAAALCMLAAGALFIAYYAFYMAFTPAECLLPDQWQKIWGTAI